MSVIPLKTSQGPSGQLRLRITAAAERIVRCGHPWLFADSIRQQNRPGQSGELAVVYDRNNRFLALGLYDAESPIRVRVLHTGKPLPVDRNFWVERLEQACRKREGLFDSQTTGFRWIHGESDGWPGLVLDRYDSTLVLKLYSIAWLPWLAMICEILIGRLAPERIVLRLSRNIQAVTGAWPNTDGQILLGTSPESAVTFRESGLRFEADVIRGQKTGFFLDQRENRRRIGDLTRGCAVLNAFSFSGGFSLYAARGGANSVTDLDISAHALTAAKRNFALNQHLPQVLACKDERVQADAFKWLAHSTRRVFNLVVLDPPSLARRETERAGALLAYFKLASLGIMRLAPGGVLLACSCSAHVSEPEFCDAIHRAASKSRRHFLELWRSGHPPDHPATFEEAKYLKAICLSFK